MNQAEDRCHRIGQASPLPASALAWTLATCRTRCAVTCSSALPALRP
jgi:hypothetical protein